MLQLCIQAEDRCVGFEEEIGHENARGVALLLIEDDLNNLTRRRFNIQCPYLISEVLGQAKALSWCHDLNG